MKISINFAHYNRPAFLRRTLYAYYYLHEDLHDIEFIIVDDDSKEQTAEKVYEEFKDKLNIKYFQRKNKDDMNGVVAINLAAAYSSGEILVLANPECLPITPIINELKYIDMKNTYYSFLCYAVPIEYQYEINQLDYMNDNFVYKIIEGLDMKRTRPKQIWVGDCWYNHPVYRPAFFHFTAAISRKNFIEMGGFDEDFRYGQARDDADFVRRVALKELDLKFSKGIVLHQHHYNETWGGDGYELEGPAYDTNKELYDKKLLKEIQWKADTSLLYSLEEEKSNDITNL